VPADLNESLITSWCLSLHSKRPSTRDAYPRRLRAFADGRDLLTVTRDDCRQYLLDMEHNGRARTTVRNHWVALKSFYGFLAEEGEVKVNPMDGVKNQLPEPPPPEFPDDDTFARVMKTTRGGGDDLWNRRDAAMLQFCAATGVRIGELLALEVGDIDLAHGFAIVRHGKGDRARTVVFDDETARMLDRYMRMRGRHAKAQVPQLWICRNGALGHDGAQRMLERRCIKAGVKPFGFHKLRHRFAHEFLSRGGDEGALQMLGGWRNPTVMRRYGSSLAAQRAAETYKRIGGVL
jgi:integrase/recombinase XerD